jgi:hypothetical protein
VRPDRLGAGDQKNMADVFALFASLTAREHLNTPLRQARSHGRRR